MPSDELIAQVTEAVAGPAEAFRSALATTLEQIRSIMGAAGSHANGKSERFQAELGRFAMGRIDADRFATLVASDNGTSPAAIERIQRAFETLAALLAERGRLLHVQVEEGADLRQAVADRTRHVGTAFGAARVVDLARTDRYREADHGPLLDALPFERWSTGERAVAPPLIVEVCGNDLRPTGLAEFLDGTQKIVLLISGACPPAALVRLISPRVFVLQTTDGSGLERLAAFKGPAIAAVVPDSAARFVHDPDAGVDLSARLQVDFLPEDRPIKPLAGLSPAQQADELAQLATLGSAGTVSTAAALEGADAAAAALPADPADKLAAWLLRQADLPGA